MTELVPFGVGLAGLWALPLGCGPKDDERSEEEQAEEEDDYCKQETEDALEGTDDVSDADADDGEEG